MIRSHCPDDELLQLGNSSSVVVHKWADLARETEEKRPGRCGVGWVGVGEGGWWWRCACGGGRGEMVKTLVNPVIFLKPK